MGQTSSGNLEHAQTASERKVKWSHTCLAYMDTPVRQTAPWPLTNRTRIPPVLIPSKPSRPSKGDNGGMQPRIPLNTDYVACPNKDLVAVMILQHTSSRYIDSRLHPLKTHFSCNKPMTTEWNHCTWKSKPSLLLVSQFLLRDLLLNILLSGDDKFLGLYPDKSSESLQRFESVQGGILLTLMTIDFVW